MNLGRIRLMEMTPADAISLLATGRLTDGKPLCFPLSLVIIEGGQKHEYMIRRLKDFPVTDLQCEKCQPNRWFVKWGKEERFR